MVIALEELLISEQKWSRRKDNEDNADNEDEEF